MPTPRFHVGHTLLALACTGPLSACSSDPANPASAYASTSTTSANTSGTTAAGDDSSSTAAATTGAAAGDVTVVSSSTGMIPTAASTTGGGGASGTTASLTTASVVTGGGPASCTDAAAAYVVTATPLDASLVPSSGGGFNSGSRTMLPVSIGAAGEVYFGLNSEAGAIVASTSGLLVTTADATLGGVAATANGVAALYFGEMWAQVTRYDNSGQELFSSDLFRSPNLDDEGTKGEASTSRLAYMSATDTVVAYFGHTQRYDDGVRHQGGYLATLDSQGTQELLNGWFGSHNLDQRLWTGESTGAVIGLGDAYPIGIFYSEIGDNPRPEVIYRLAAAGNGTANGQLGGIVELSQELIMPFITNLSVSPDIDAGQWPDIDETVASQIRDAAANGTDMGLLRVPKSGSDGEAPTVWLAPELTAGARLVRLKSARYGEGDMILLLWAEASGDNRSESLSYFTMVVEATGAVCQPKTQLDSAYAVTSGDDIVRGPSGQIYWASTEASGLSLITLAPQ